jgi:hypothetical protein
MGYEDDNSTVTLRQLVRIGNALERIADSLEGKGKSDAPITMPKFPPTKETKDAR